MNKASTLLLVAIVSAGGGAGLMWMVSHGPGSSPRAITDIAQPRGSENAGKRTGIAEPFQPAASSEQPGTANQRVNPSVLAELAGPAVSSNGTQAGDTGVTSRSGAESRSGDVNGSLASPPTRTPSMTLLRGNVARTTGFDKAKVNEALASALQAALPYTKEGYTTRDDYWGGALDRSPKAVLHQLFRGNEYWFWLGADRRDVSIDVHIYDSDGNLAEAEHWQKGNVAAAHVVPANTGAYYITVSARIEDSPADPSNAQIHWALAYGYR